MAEQDIKKGLAGVVVDYTAVSKVNPTPTRCCTAATRCRSSPPMQRFEEVAYLLWHGELPTAAAGRVRAPSAPAAPWTRWSSR